MRNVMILSLWGSYAM